jgi:transcriptional regulator with XRE-family HTH domain
MQKHPVRKRAIMEAVADARRAAELSQRQLSERLGEAINYVQRIESGERGLQVSEFIEVARAIGIDPVELLRRCIR